jgi:hypothetical protein
MSTVNMSVIFIEDEVDCIVISIDEGKEEEEE